MRETDFHAWLKRIVPPADGVILGIGDDAAVLDTSGRIVAASDILVEGVHYDPDRVSPEQIGAKAVNRNFSDMAAMGVAPQWILVSAAVPENVTERFMHELVRGMRNACKVFGADMVGGDTSRSRGGLVIDVTVIGEAGDLDPVTRSGALHGDRILVTGTLGGSASGKHMDFVPRVREAVFLNRRHRPSCMMDISDGLSLDLHRLLDCSAMGCVVAAENVPVSKAARELAASSKKSALEHALGDGEDFELLFTMPQEKAKALIDDTERRFDVSDVGEVVEGPGRRTIVSSGKETPLERKGYDHFV